MSAIPSQMNANAVNVLSRSCAREIFMRGCARGLIIKKHNLPNHGA